MATYVARFVPDAASPGWYVVTVPGVPGVLTQASSIDDGLARIREALALFVDDADGAEIVPEIANA